MHPEDSRNIMANQIESGIKEELADYVIFNNKGLGELKDASMDVLEEIKASVKRL